MRNLVVAVLMLCFSVFASAAEVRLPAANFDGYTTDLALTNVTAAAIEMPNPLGSPGIGAGNITIPAYTTVRFANWPEPGGATYVLDVPDGVAAFTEVRDPLNQAMRIAPVPVLEVGETARLHALAVDGFASYAFIHAPDGGSANITAYDADGNSLGTEYLIFSPDETQIPQLPPGADRVEVRAGAFGWPEKPLVIFGFLSHQPDGEMLPVIPLVEKRP